MTLVDKFVKETSALINLSQDLCQSTYLRKNYRKIRNCGKSLRILIGSLSHIFIKPKNCHEISRLILNLEKPFQHNKRKRCLLFFRKQLGTNSETEKFISFLDEPGYLQELKFIWIKFLDSMNSNLCTFSILKVVSAVLVSSFFFFDILKDISLYLLLQQYLASNTSSAPIETFLVHMSLSCLVLSHTVIGIQCIFNWPQMFKSTADYSCCKKGLIFLVLLIMSPLLPTMVAMHGVCVSLDKDAFISQYRKNTNSMDITTLMNTIEIYDLYLSVNAKNHAYVRIIESMLEASPQVIVVILLAIWQSTNGSVNGVIDLLVQSENRKSLILFVLSVPSSALAIILSILKFTNTFKQGSIGLKSSFILIAAYFFLFLGKVSSLITILSPCYIVYSSITQNNIIACNSEKWDPINVLNVTNLHIPSTPLLPNFSWLPPYLRISLLSLVHPYLPVALPVILLSLLSHMVFVFIYCHKHVPDFQTSPLLDRVFHCLANLLVPIPFHTFTETPQRRRWKEYRAYILSSLTTSVLIFMGCVLARQATPLRGIEHLPWGGSSPDNSNALYFPVLNNTLHYLSSHDSYLYPYLVPYDHPYIYIFTIMYDYNQPIARFLNLIFHLPWLLFIFFSHGLGGFVLGYYYRNLHLWSSITSQHTAEELLERSEDDKYVEGEEQEEDKGSCLKLVNFFSYCKKRLEKRGETIFCKCSPERWQLSCCKCHPNLRNFFSSHLRCKCHSKPRNCISSVTCCGGWARGRNREVSIICRSKHKL